MFVPIADRFADWINVGHRRAAVRAFAKVFTSTFYA
ncbi:hypothetical protein MEME101129_23495 [Methylobacterium mesophilicum]